MEFHGSKLNYGAAYEDDFPSLPSAVLFCNLKTFTKLSEGHSFFLVCIYIFEFHDFARPFFSKKGLLSLSTNLSEDIFFYIRIVNLNTTL